MRQPSDAWRRLGGARFGTRVSGPGQDSARVQGTTLSSRADDGTHSSDRVGSRIVGFATTRRGQSPQRGADGARPDKTSSSRADRTSGSAMNATGTSMYRGAHARRVSAAYENIYFRTFRAISWAETPRTHRIARRHPPSRPSAARTRTSAPVNGCVSLLSRLNVYGPSVTCSVRSRCRAGP